MEEVGLTDAPLKGKSWRGLGAGWYRWATVASIAAAALLVQATAVANTVVVTPSSLSGYTFFPPSSSGGQGDGTGENVSTLQRCYKQPSAGDRTINMADRNWYDVDKPIQVYVRAYGGDGGIGPAGGGGGASAVLKNGAPVVIAPGGNGNKSAQLTTGSFSLSKNDTLRFIVGGGGGGSFGSTSTTLIGGSGGAGYKGGGGGASTTGKVTGGDPNMGGKGGGTTPGAGGYVTPGFQISGSYMAGTAGNDTNGGVATFPDGSSQPLGSYSTTGDGMRLYSSSFNIYPTYKQNSYASRWPATLGFSGSVVMGNIGGMVRTGDLLTFAGAGGGAGSGGTPPGSSFSDSTTNWVNTQSKPNSPATLTYFYKIYSNLYYPNCGYTPRAGETYAAPMYTVCGSAQFPPNLDSFNVQRQIESPQGSYPGLIVVMFQAATCELIPNHDEQ